MNERAERTTPGNRKRSGGAGVSLRRVAVVGASGGIGSALVDRLRARAGTQRIYALSRAGAGPADDILRPGRLDLENERSIAEAARQIGEDGPLDAVIVASGFLHRGDTVTPEKNWRSLSADAMQEAFRINAIGPALLAKHFLPLFGRRGPAVFAALSARVGSIGDNRLGGWYSYRASKAALNMILRTLAIEMARRNPDACLIGVHPGTVDTGLSRPYQSNVPDGKLFSPDEAASYILDVVTTVKPEDSGHILAWDGTKIPY